MPPEPDPEYFPGQYIVAKIARRFFDAMITDINAEAGEVEVSMLSPKLPSDILQWPEDLHSIFIPIPHIICPVDLQDKIEYTH